MKTNRLSRFILAVAATLALCVSCGIKTIPQTKTIDYSYRGVPTSHLQFAVVEGDYILKADVRELTAAITLWFVVLNEKIPSENEVFKYYESGGRRTDMARGYATLIPMDKLGNEIVIGGNTTENVLTIHLADFMSMAYTKAGVGTPLTFKIKVKNRKQLAAIMEMDAFRFGTTEDAETIIATPSQYEEKRAEGYKIISMSNYYERR